MYHCFDFYNLQFYYILYIFRYYFLTLLDLFYLNNLNYLFLLNYLKFFDILLVLSEVELSIKLFFRFRLTIVLFSFPYIVLFKL